MATLEELEAEKLADEELLDDKRSLAYSIRTNARKGNLKKYEEYSRAKAKELGVKEEDLEAYVRNARSIYGVSPASLASDAKIDQAKDEGRARERFEEERGQGLRTPGEIAEERLLDEQGISALDAGGFAERDRVRTSVNRSVADEKRLKRATNLAYRQRVKFGDLRGALGILKDAKADGVTFGGVSPAGETRKNVIAGKGAHLKKHKQEVGEEELAPQADAGLPNNPVLNMAQGGLTERATAQLAEGYKPRRKGGRYPRGGSYLTQGGMAY